MPLIIIYTKQGDPYCARAKELLRRKKVPFEERSLPHHERELIKRIGTTDVPQLFLNDHHIGTFEQLSSLELKGQFDKLLAEHGHAHIDWHPDQPRT